ncbi:B12-binding domain-containing radical SAM protein [Chloroflexota bacterium]
MKVLILNPYYCENFVRSARWAARSRGRVQRHPDFLAIATAVLEEKGHNAKLLDAATLNMNIDKVRSFVEEFKPELSVIFTTTPSIYSDIEYTGMLKGLGSKTVLIGQHASALPEETMKLSDNIDYIARGEYDYTLRDLADDKKPEDIPGLTYRNGSEIITTGDRPMIENLDEMPFPAWHQVDIHDYFDAGKLYPFITILSGRGCPNNCSFCVLPQVFYGKKYRMRSVQKVIDEIEYDLKLFPDLKEIMFEDDTLTVDIKRCNEICNKIISRGIKIIWSANARADLDNLDLLKLMKASGCRMLVVGFEFGDQQVLKNVNKGVTLEQMRRFASLTRQVGIKIHGCFMIGGPGDTRETAEKTIELARELKPDTLQFSALVPYPGTKFYEWCQENNYIIAKDWSDWVDAGEQSTVVEYPNLTKEEIVSLVDKGLYKNFYFRPSTWIHHLMTINSFDDFKRKARGAKSLVGYWWRNRKK